jgi:hypothetical protein
MRTVPARKEARRAAPDASASPIVEEAQRRLERRIRAHLPRGGVDVTFTDNRYTMISVKREQRNGPFYRVRLHHMFATASPGVTQALARYIARNDRGASTMLGDFIDANQHRVRAKGKRTPQARLLTRGRVHDLQAIFDEVNRDYFGGTLRARITWGQRTGRPRRRNSIKMGSYSVEDGIIRVHRSLDRAFVPRFFVAWVVYHEMLHEVHPVTVINGRRQFHPPAFMADEARFVQFEEARAWERRHLDEILTY